MGLQHRSDLKQVVLDFNGAEYTAKTVWNIGAWNDISNTWLGQPDVVEDVMPSVDAAGMKKFNDAIGVALATALRENVKLKTARDAAKSETALAQSIAKDQQDHIAWLLADKKAVAGSLAMSEQLRKEANEQLEKLRYAWGVAADTLARRRSWKYRLTLGFFGS